MKPINPLIATLCVLLANLGSITLAAPFTETYRGTFGREKCEVRIQWDNFDGLGDVNGKLVLDNGGVVSFFGSNSRKGYMEIEIQGTTYKLEKERDGDRVTWSGGRLSFSKTAGGSPPDTATPTGNARTIKYTGFYRGKPCTGSLKWTTEDGLGNFEGMLVVDGDMALGISGSEIRPAYLEVGVAGDDSIVHKLNKEMNGGRVSWVGRFLSLSETTKANPDPTAGTTKGNNNGSAPPSRSTKNSGQSEPTEWIIACEAEGNRQEAEAAADRWRVRGFSSGVLWIPDYSSLSGAKLWLAFVHGGEYSDRAGAKAVLSKVRRFYKDAMGLKLDQSGKRETLN